MKTFVIPLLLAATVAQGAVVAEVVAGDKAVRLHDEPGPCVVPALMAVFQDGMHSIIGCWKLEGATVRLVFLDGDTLDLPAVAFRKPKLL